MVEHPRLALRRLPPDAVQIQVILGSLLGDGRLVGRPTDRRLHIRHSALRADYVRWKYERLGALAADPPRRSNGHVELETIAHPVFDDLAQLFCRPDGSRQVRREAVLPLLGPVGLAVWLTDVGRLELRANSFLPAQRALASELAQAPLLV